MFLHPVSLSHGNCNGGICWQFHGRLHSEIDGCASDWGLPWVSGSSKQVLLPPHKPSPPSVWGGVRKSLECNRPSPDRLAPALLPPSVENRGIQLTPPSTSGELVALQQCGHDGGVGRLVFARFSDFVPPAPKGQGR